LVFPGNIVATSIAQANVKLNPVEFGVDLRPGWLVSPDTLLYGRVGVAINRVRLQSASLGVLSIPGYPIIAGTLLAPSSSKNIAGLRLGMGVEKHISPHLSLRADYIFTYYGKIHADQSFSIPSLPLAFTNNADVKLMNHSVMLGLSYYFST
jgi:opacity protein-like surface antigen